MAKIKRFCVQWAITAVCISACVWPSAQGATRETPPNAAITVPVPDFSSGGMSWVAVGRGELIQPDSGPGPVTNDPAHPRISIGSGRQPTFRIADVSNPNLKPWAAEQMKLANDEILFHGKIEYTPQATCRPAGVPGFSSLPNAPVYFIQSRTEVLMVWSGSPEIRRIYLNVPHSANVRPSWYGESVGHYEGNALIVDTIGLNTKTFVDTFRTPHTEALHVTERYEVIEGGRTLEVRIRVEDPGTFNMPWTAIQRYRRVEEGPLEERSCAENNANFEMANNVGYATPVSEIPDF